MPKYAAHKYLSGCVAQIVKISYFRGNSFRRQGVSVISIAGRYIKQILVLGLAMSTEMTFNKKELLFELY